MSSSLVKYESVNNQPGVPGTVNDITTDLQPENGHAFRRLLLSAPRGGLPAGTWMILYWAGDATTNDYTSQVQIAISPTQMWFREASGLNTWNAWQQSNSGAGGGGGPFPQGLLAEQVAGGGTATINGVTITSIDPELVVTNGNGVGGNPTLNINLTAQGLIPGGVVQNAIDYMGEVDNALNGFSAYYASATPLVIPISSNTPIIPTDDGTSIMHMYGYIGTGYTAATATFVPPVTSPVQATVAYDISVTVIGNFATALATGQLEAQIWDVGAGVNVDGALMYAPANTIVGTQGATMSFGGVYMLTPGESYQLRMDNTDTLVAAAVSYAHWSATRLR